MEDYRPVDDAAEDGSGSGLEPGTAGQPQGGSSDDEAAPAASPSEGGAKAKKRRKRGQKLSAIEFEARRDMVKRIADCPAEEQADWLWASYQQHAAASTLERGGLTAQGMAALPASGSLEQRLKTLRPADWQQALCGGGRAHPAAARGEEQPPAGSPSLLLVSPSAIGAVGLIKLCPSFHKVCCSWGAAGRPARSSPPAAHAPHTAVKPCGAPCAALCAGLPHSQAVCQAHEGAGTGGAAQKPGGWMGGGGAREGRGVVQAAASVASSFRAGTTSLTAPRRLRPCAEPLILLACNAGGVHWRGHAQPPVQAGGRGGAAAGALEARGAGLAAGCQAEVRTLISTCSLLRCWCVEVRWVGAGGAWAAPKRFYGQLPINRRSLAHAAHTPPGGCGWRCGQTQRHSRCAA
jgi:hypothetical protein